VRALLPTEVKQIGGRAGRFRSRFPNGEVSCFGGRAELRFLGTALGASLEPLKACGLLPTAAQLEAFARTAGARPFSQLLRGYFESTRTDEARYFVCSVEEMYRIARLVDPLELTIAERLEFCVAPVDTSEPRLAAAFWGYAKAYAAGSSVRVGVRAPAEVPRTDREISALEGTHAILDAYLWLGQKFESQFCEGERARALRDRVSGLISAGLSGGLMASDRADGARGRHDADVRRAPGPGRRDGAARASRSRPPPVSDGARRRSSRRA
jgi:ATP-dependent RNA helicase SUPV3L1/SUV3